VSTVAGTKSSGRQGLQLLLLLAVLPRQRVVVFVVVGRLLFGLAVPQVATLLLLLSITERLARAG
jgi:hypothetical protein